MVRLGKQIGHLFERKPLEKPVGLHRGLHFLADQVFLRGEGFFFKPQDGFRLGCAETRFREHARPLAILQATQEGQEHRRGQPRAESRRKQILAHLRQTIDRVVVGMFFGENRVDHLQQLGVFPSLENDGGPFFPRHGLEFAPGVLRLDGVVQVALDGQVEPLLRTLLDLEAHARRKTQ